MAPKKTLVPKTKSEAPKTKEAHLGSTIDLWWKTREQRLLLDKESDRLKEEERHLKAELIGLLHEAGIKGAKGTFATTSIRPVINPIPVDWEKIQQHIQATGEFDLLQKRLGVEACRARFDQGVVIPGIEKQQIEELTLNKAGA
jgi:hypothetical protein